jgi:hypothetical protein
MKNLRYFLPIFLLAAIAIVGCKSSTSPSGGNGPAINSFTATPGTINLATTDSTVLSWSIDGSPTSVTIDQGVGDQTNNGANSIAVFPSSNTTYTLTAKNGNGTSTKTVTVTVNNPSDAGAPPIPQGLTASAGATSPSTINLSWTASAGAATYIVERKLAGQGFIQLTNTATGASYADKGLYPGFIYTYRIRAVNSGGARSGYSNNATATAPGTPPHIANIALAPASLPSSLTPGQTQQFTVTATDDVGNVLPFAPQSYTWMTSNGANVTVDQNGLATAQTTQGSAQITASLPQQGDVVNPVVSNAVTVTVVNKTGSATTAVIFYGSGADEFTNYGGATSNASALVASGVAFDAFTDFTDGGDPQFTVAQLAPYSRVVVLTGGGTSISDNAVSTLATYAELGGKTLVIIGTGGAQQLSNATLQSVVGISNDGYISTGDLNFTIQGQSGTAFSGLTFTQQSNVSYVDNITLSGANAKPALVGTTTADGSQVIIAFQSSILNGSSKFLYSGANIDFVDAAHKSTFVNDFMNF